MKREKQAVEVSQTDKIINWMQEYSTQILYGIAAVVVLFIMLYAWMSHSASNEERDYLRAEAAYQEFSASAGRDNPSASPSFIELQAILQRRVELASRYNGLLAQLFLQLGDQKMALFYGQKALKNLSKENLPFYEDFSRTSLLIADKDFSEALRRAQYLSEKMIEAEDSTQPSGFGHALISFNMLRIAMLHQKLGNAKAEMDSWQKLEQLTKRKRAGEKQGDERLFSMFATGTISLNDYIAMRKKSLNQ